MNIFLRPNLSWQRSIAGMIIFLAMALVACSGDATSTPVTTTTTGSTPVSQPQATSVPSSAVAARDSIVLVVAEQPAVVAALGAGGGISQAVHHDNMSDPLTWQSGDDQRIVPTSATTGWEQVGPSKWRFFLREGVKFHNGEPWNAQAALPSLAILASSENDNPSYGYTGGYTAEAVDEFTLDINCTTPCPIFPNTAFFANFTAPDFLASTTEEDRARQNVSSVQISGMGFRSFDHPGSV